MEILNVKVLEDIHLGRPLKLNLGAGQLQNNFYSLDICKLEGIDIVADLNEPLDKLPNDCVSEVYSRHVFEHVSNFGSAPISRVTIAWQICSY